MLLNHLKCVLKIVSLNHTAVIKEHVISRKNTYYRESYTLPTNEVLTLNEAIDKTNILNIDKERLKEHVEKLKLSCGLVFRQNNLLYVNATDHRSQIFYRDPGSKSDNELLLSLKTKHQKLPLVYDVLLIIFNCADQNLRQKHFHQLIHYYYRHLQENLKTLELDITTILTLNDYKTQVHKFLPYIKAEVVYQLYKYLNVRCRPLFNKSILELNEIMLNPKLSREDCYKIVLNKVGSNDYEFINYRLTHLQHRIGTLRDHSKLEISIKYQNNDTVLPFFAKHLPTSTEFAIGEFKKEAFVYQVFIPELIICGLEELTDFLPKCYFGRLSDVIVLEDMSTLRYRGTDADACFTFEHLDLAIKPLVKFHACALIYEEMMTKKSGKTVRLNEVFKEFIEDTEVPRNIDSKRKQVACGIASILKYGLEVFPDIVKNLTEEEFIDRASILYCSFFERGKTSKKFRNVLCHCDVRVGNILFKTENCDTPVDCCFIDYQSIKYCPPAEDLMELFYFVTNKATRTQYMSIMISKYYNELSDVLYKYGFDLNRIYTYNQFVECCNYTKPSVICQASLILPLVLYPQDKTDKLVNNDEKIQHILNIDRAELFEELLFPGSYRYRIREIIEDLYEICENKVL